MLAAFQQDDLQCSDMLTSHLLGSYLCNAKDMPTVCQLSTELLFPRLWSGSLPTMVRYIPGGELVRRHSVCVDIAWILYGRQRQGFDGPIDAADGVGGVSCWSWADSSPQAQHDWFQTKEAWAFDRWAVPKTSSQCPPLGVGWGHVPPSQRSTPWHPPSWCNRSPSYFVFWGWVGTKGRIAIWLGVNVM